MLRIALRVVIFVVAAALVLVAELFAYVAITGEVSCRAVCSKETRWLESAAPWPAVAAYATALGAGWLASLVVPVWTWLNRE